MSQTVNTREIVLYLLLSIEKGEDFSHKLLKNTLDKYDYLDRKDKAFMKRILEGTLERGRYIDFCIDAYANTPVRKMKPLIRVLMRMSVYQLLYMDTVPDRAVCNEAVKLCAKRKFINLKGFINGTLRKIASEKEKLPIPSKDNIVEYLSIIHSMPEWIVEKFIKEIGEEQTKLVLESFLETKPVTIRFKQSLQKDIEEELLEEMKECGIEYTKNQYLQKVYALTHLDGMHQVPGFNKGLLTVQDVSSMLAVEICGIKEGDFVLDVCAAPGGKSILAAEYTKSSGRVLARDLTEMKTSFIEENAGRMMIDNIDVEVYDATILDNNMLEKADIVIADLPCSGLGIMGKKRDIKLHVTQDSLIELGCLQKIILDNVVKYVKPGGT